MIVVLACLLLFAACKPAGTEGPLPSQQATLPTEEGGQAMLSQLPGRFLAWQGALYYSNGTDAVFVLRTGSEPEVYMLADMPFSLAVYRDEVACLAVAARGEDFLPVSWGIFAGPEAALLATGNISWMGAAGAELYYVENNARLLTLSGTERYNGLITGAATDGAYLYLSADDALLRAPAAQGEWETLKQGGVLGLIHAGAKLYYAKEDAAPLFRFTAEEGESAVKGEVTGIYSDQNAEYILRSKGGALVLTVISSAGKEEIVLLEEEPASAAGPFYYNDSVYVFAEADSYVGLLRVLSNKTVERPGSGGSIG